MAKTLTTPKGTTLPLTNLKGKDYLMVAYRLQWFNEVEKNFEITTEFLHVDDTQTVCKSTITIFDETGKIVRKASGTKRETMKDFPDHTEKAETGSIGRALLMLGYGTQFALNELDEGNRIVDAPVVDVKLREEKKAVVAVSNVQTEVAPPKPAGGFGVKKAPVAVKEDDGGWQ